MITMRRKLLAVAVMTVIFAGMMSVPASAGTWSEYWGAFTGYVSEKWDSVVAYVGGLFAKNEDSLPQESSENLPEAVAENWVKLTGTLSDTLTLRDKQETLPKSSWLPFREDQKSNGEKINALLDRALSILVKVMPKKSGGMQLHSGTESQSRGQKLTTSGTNASQLRKNHVTL